VEKRKKASSNSLENFFFKEGADEEANGKAVLIVIRNGHQGGKVCGVDDGKKAIPGRPALIGRPRDRSIRCQQKKKLHLPSRWPRRNSGETGGRAK